MAHYDLHFQPVPASRVAGVKCIEFGYRAALKVTGFRSLINRWLKTFLTPLGSDVLDPTMGTAVTNLLNANIDRFSTEIQDAIVLAVIKATEQIKKQDTDGLYPVEEQLQNATIQTYEESSAGVTVWILIENKAGSSLSIPAISLATRTT
jgi:hypothetical protein